MTKVACLTLVVVAVVPLGASPSMTEPATQQIAVSKPVSYARVYTDAEGESHFAEDSLSFQLVDYAPPAPPISVSQVFGAENASFISSPPGWYGDWHPAPHRQFVLVLVGELEVRVSDGEVRRLPAGSLCLVEDTVGTGHASRVVGQERVLAAAIPLVDETE
jgi:quercetin dioxygenase-like cupin family protein